MFLCLQLPDMLFDVSKHVPIFRSQFHLEDRRQPVSTFQQQKGILVYTLQIFFFTKIQLKVLIMKSTSLKLNSEKTITQ
jgi:hypothetical protein